VIDSLRIGALAVPLSRALQAVTTYLPQVAAAAVLVLVGYVLGRAARFAVRTLLQRSGLDRAADRYAGRILGEQRPSGILGTAVMVIVLFHFVASALGRLQIPELSQPLGLVLDQAYGYLPKLFVGVLVLAVGVVAGRLVAFAAARVLAGLGFDTVFEHIGIVSPGAERPVSDAGSPTAVAATSEPGRLFAMAPGVLQTPSGTLGAALGVVVFLLLLKQALELLGLTGLAHLLDGLLGYLPQVLAAVAVLGAGLWAGRWVRERLRLLTLKSEDRYVRASVPIAHIAIVAFAAMVALQQLGVGRQLIAIAFALVLGAACLALALAFGLGGRHAAAKFIAKEVDRGAAPHGRRERSSPGISSRP
jgi:hypothetical protein